MKKNQSGFGIVEVLIAVVVLVVIGFLGWNAFSLIKNRTSESKNNSQPQNVKEESNSNSKSLIWQQTADGWQSTQSAQKCTDQPMLKAPTDLSKVTSVLYPGQTRGGNYKPHGGLRFDNSTDNTVVVTAPIDGYLVRGGSYIAEGELQYTFDAMNNCGIMYRVGHLRELPENLQKIASTWPEPTSNSATQSISPAVFIKQGEVLATKVGILAEKNTFFDFGVYDYRNLNEASKSPAYQSAHPQDKELAWHAVCWLKDWLPGNDVSTLAALPAGDSSSGKNSDYCQ